MQEFCIDRKRWSQKFIFGTFMIVLGIVWGREAFFAKPTQWLETVFFALFTCYGALVLSQSFFATIKTDETGLSIRKTLLPAKKIRYDEITGMFYDVMHGRMVLVLNGTKRWMFAYLYEDVQGFVKHLATHCTRLQQGENGI